MSEPAVKPATAADLLARDDDALEVVAGEIVEKAAPSFRHSDAQLGGGSFLRTHFHHGGGGSSGPGGWWIVTECEVELEANEVYRPDLVGWRRARLEPRPTERPVTVRPDWVCEIVSPSNASNDLVVKLRVYQRAGVPYDWIVDPDQQVLTVYRLREANSEVALTATRGETVQAEPFDALPFPVGIFFGDEE